MHSAMMQSSINIPAGGESQLRAQFNSHKKTKNKTLLHMRLNQLSREISQTTKHFDMNEVEALLYVYETLCDHHSKVLDKSIFCDFFRNCLGVYEQFLLERLFKALDVDEDGHLNYHEWVRAMELLLVGNVEELAPLMFRTYSDCWPKISRVDLLYLVNKLAPTETVDMGDMLNDSNETMIFMREIIMVLLDCDGDGVISMEDYLQAVTEEPLLLECLGECLPSPEMKQGFLSLFHQTSKSYNERLTYLTTIDYENLQRLRLVPHGYAQDSSIRSKDSCKQGNTKIDNEKAHDDEEVFLKDSAE